MYCSSNIFTRVLAVTIIVTLISSGVASAAGKALNMTKELNTIASICIFALDHKNNDISKLLDHSYTKKRRYYKKSPHKSKFFNKYSSLQVEMGRSLLSPSECEVRINNIDGHKGRQYFSIFRNALLKSGYKEIVLKDKKGRKFTAFSKKDLVVMLRGRISSSQYGELTGFISMGIKK